MSMHPQEGPPPLESTPPPVGAEPTDDEDIDEAGTSEEADDEGKTRPSTSGPAKPRRWSWKKRIGVGFLAFLAFLVVLALGPGSDHVRGARLFYGFLAAGNTPGEMSIDELEVGGLRAKVYTDGNGAPPLVFLHGLHPQGIDDYRFVRFARLLNEAGYTVLTPEVPEMRAMTFSSKASQSVNAAVGDWAERSGYTSVGATAVCFGGAMVMIAASEQADLYHAVWTIGAPHDVLRNIRWWGGEKIVAPNGEVARPVREISDMNFGAHSAVMFFPEVFVDEQHVPEFLRLLHLWLKGKTRDQAEAEAAKAHPQIAEVFRQLREDPGPLMEKYLAARSEQTAVYSPKGHLHKLKATPFLLHAKDDLVMSSTEVEFYKADLPPKLREAGRFLRTPLLNHADAGTPTPGAVWDLVDFTADTLEGLDGR